MNKPVFLIAALSAALCFAEEAPKSAESAAKAELAKPAAKAEVAKPAVKVRRHPRIGADGKPLRRTGRDIYGRGMGRMMNGPIITDFGKTAKGEKASLYRLMGQGGMILDLSDHGARCVRIYAPDRHGNLVDVTVGYNDVSGYEQYDRNFNATVGRFANRMAAGKFKVDGQEYQLPLNWPGNGTPTCCLHGGTNAMNFAIWKARPVRRPHAQGVEFTYVSPDGDQGFPGTMTVKVTHWLTAGNVWAIDYEAKVEGKACPINLTNHAYFNLKGIGNGDINDHVLQIFASKYTPVNEGMIPTGEILDVKGTPFDFLEPHVIGERLASDHPQMKLGKGYDHNWVIDNVSGQLKKVAVLTDPASGRFVETWTTEPGLQVYGGNVMSGGKGAPKPVPNKTGGTLPWRGAVALETQHFPDSPNHENFPNTILRPGELFRSRTEYRFGAK